MKRLQTLFIIALSFHVSLACAQSKLGLDSTNIVSAVARGGLFKAISASSALNFLPDIGAGLVYHKGRNSMGLTLGLQPEATLRGQTSLFDGTSPLVADKVRASCIEINYARWILKKHTLGICGTASIAYMGATFSRSDVGTFSYIFIGRVTPSAGARLVIAADTKASLFAQANYHPVNFGSGFSQNSELKTNLASFSIGLMVNLYELND
jgi:hypothetical protein